MQLLTSLPWFTDDRAMIASLSGGSGEARSGVGAPDRADFIDFKAMSEEYSIG
jgi:hypothetical protein